ncbi:MAG: hypothetical protein J7623_22950 [Chitinophaga sp.]|uniref:hypothetical protein n=1 Tax=Chitinophaga sp. TaxID=1869181 RepID=UPI001B275EBB|nr:hypothetical protein [Chitinophaga sp.]MBO9731517.1 hypothetical protein [Chitinophaga sp.]
MRILKILLLLLTISSTTFATDAALAKILASLTKEQHALLYQYGTLNTWAGPAVADSFWRQHQPELGSISPEQGKLLAAELLANTELSYAMKKPSRLQALWGVFTASRLLIGLAALVGAFAIIQLLGRYIPTLWRKLLRYLSPLFRWLFSPRMLTWELFIAGLAGVYWGPHIDSVEIRTGVIQVGLLMVWAQLTAILTRQYEVKDYLNVIKDCFDQYHTEKHAFLYVSLPALFTAVLIFGITRVCPDMWYRYELIVPAMIGLYALPFIPRLEPILSRVLLPFTYDRLRAKDRRLAAYVVVSLVVWVAILLLPIVPREALLTLTFGLIGALLLISMADVLHSNGKNYWWLQLVTLAFLFTVVLAGAQQGLLLFTWAGLGGMLVYVLIKYWEMPTMFGWSWKNKRAWGALGMALLIWGIAVLIRSRPEWFTLFPG